MGEQQKFVVCICSGGAINVIMNKIVLIVIELQECVVYRSLYQLSIVLF